MRRFNDSENVNVAKEVKMQEKGKLRAHFCLAWRLIIFQCLRIVMVIADLIPSSLTMVERNTMQIHVDIARNLLTWV